MTADEEDGGGASAMFEELSASLIEMQSLLAGTATFQSFLTDLAALAVRSFPEAVSASVTLVRDGRPETVVSSDDSASEADLAQYAREEGPCLSAYSTGIEVVVDDLEAETRFGEYPAQALALGLRSLVALPLRSAGDAMGAFNLYSGKPSVFTDGSLVRARMLCAAAAGALEVARRVTEQAQLNDDLKAAMASR